MYVTHLVVTVLAAVASVAAAIPDFTRATFVVANMERYQVPISWLTPLGVLKVAGALGLLVGIAVPPLGIAAAVGLVLYFIGAEITVLRVRAYSHLAFPAPFLLLAAAALVTRPAV